MFLTASSELAPGQWVDMALTRTVGFQGIWLLIYVSGLMFVMRHFAGSLSHKLSPVGLFEFHRANDCIELGREATERALPDIYELLEAARKVG